MCLPYDYYQRSEDKLWLIPTNTRVVVYGRMNVLKPTFKPPTSKVNTSDLKWFKASSGLHVGQWGS